VSIFLGVAAAKVVGGDVQNGGSTAASGTRNNVENIIDAMQDIKLQKHMSMLLKLLRRLY